MQIWRFYKSFIATRVLICFCSLGAGEDCGSVEKWRIEGLGWSLGKDALTFVSLSQNVFVKILNVLICPDFKTYFSKSPNVFVSSDLKVCTCQDIVWNKEVNKPIVARSEILSFLKELSNRYGLEWSFDEGALTFVSLFPDFYITA